MDRLITDLGVFDFDKATGELVMIEINPGASLEDVRAATGCEFRVAEPLLNMDTGEAL